MEDKDFKESIKKFKEENRYLSKMLKKREWIENFFCCLEKEKEKILKEKKDLQNKKEKLLFFDFKSKQYKEET